MGWMTLHSVSCIYPETPTLAEQALASQWIDLFQATITCPTCRDHFRELLSRYRALYPDMFASRQNFMLFAFRAHNTVNRRLDKPVYLTTDECRDVLQKNLTARPGQHIRVAYLNHIRRDWANLRDANGLIGSRKVQELIRIENEYWTPRDTNSVPELESQPVLPMIMKNAEEPRAIPKFVRPMGGVRFAGGRLRFGQ